MGSVEKPRGPADSASAWDRQKPVRIGDLVQAPERRRSSLPASRWQGLPSGAEGSTALSKGAGLWSGGVAGWAAGHQGTLPVLHGLGLVIGRLTLLAVFARGAQRVLERGGAEELVEDDGRDQGGLGGAST